MPRPPDDPTALARYIETRDHNAHRAQLPGTLTLRPGDGRSWTALYDSLSTFLTDLDAHIRLKNEVLFPRFEPASP